MIAVTSIAVTSIAVTLIAITLLTITSYDNSKTKRRFAQLENADHTLIEKSSDY